MSQESKFVRLRKVIEDIEKEIGADGIDEIAYAWLMNHPSEIAPIKLRG